MRMRTGNRTAKINVKVLIILLVVVVGLGVSLVVARQVRRKILSKRDLEAGTAAYEAGDWSTAAKRLQEYLGRNPDDIEILQKYAQARLSIRPLEAASIGGAISAYRRIMQLDPLDDTPYEKLAVLYPGTGNYSDLAYIARRRIEMVPDDKKAPVWLAEALIQLNKSAEAQETLDEYISELEPLPEKHAEFVRACALMAELASKSDSADADGTAMDYLDRAVAYAPDSAEALAQRGALRRELAGQADANEADRTALLALARDDLLAADSKETDNPRVLYFLGKEWLLLGELDRAQVEVEAAKALPQDRLSEEFFDIADWQVALFSLESQLATQQGNPAEAAALADEALATLTEKRHRIQILPSAVQLYVAAGEAAKAQACLDEYVDAQYTQSGASESRLRLAYLKALVARADDNAYAVIDVLQPVVVNDTSRPELWRLLAEAYSRTDQPRRAVSALIRYLRLRPRDPQMTLELAKEYLKLRDWNRAFETARLAEPLDPTDIVLRLMRIETSVYVAAEQEQEIDVARLNALAGELAELKDNHPERVDIRILQAMIAVYLGQPDVAVEVLKNAIDECDEPLRAEMQLVRQYYRMNRMDEAVALGREACQKHPELSEPWLSLSGLYVSLNDNEAARDCLREGLDAVVGKWEKRSVTLRLALLELVDGDRQVGVDLLSELAAGDEREVHARTLLLGTREIQQDKSRAQELVDQLRAAEGQSGLTWRLQQALLWLRTEDWRSRQQNISDLLEECIDADPQWSEPVLALAELYQRLNQPSRVEEICRQALVRNPSATGIADRLIGVLEEQGRFSDAEQVLQQVQADAQVSSAWQIQMALRAGDFTGAIDELRLRVSNDDQDAESRILLARLIYWQMRDAQQAYRYLDEAQAIDPTSMALVAARASILRAEGQGQEAQGLLDAYVSNRDDFGAYMLRATYLNGQGELELAEADYRKLTTFPENSVAGHLLLSDFYASHDRLDNAIAALEEGLEQHEGESSLQRGLMRMLLRRNQDGDEDRALALLSVLEKKLPDDPELMMLRAMQLLQVRTPESLAQAKAKLESVVRMEPTALDAHLALIEILLQEGAFEEARSAALRALGANPNNPTLLAARGRAELALENTQMATQLAELALDTDPNNAQARDIITAVSLQTGDQALLERADGLLEAALRNGPVSQQMLMRHAQVLVALGRPEEAIPALESYSRTDEGAADIATLVTLTDLHRLAGDAAGANEAVARAIAIDPNNQAVVHARLLCLIAEKRYDDLEDAVTDYLATGTEDPAMLLNAAFALLACDPPGPAQAQMLFERAVEQMPTMLDAHLGLAASLYKTGQTERAEELSQELLTEYGDDAATCIAMASRLYQIGYIEGAEEMYRHVLESEPDDQRALNDLAWILQEQGQRYDEALVLANRGLAAAPDDLHLLDTRATILSHMPDRLADAKRDFERLVELSSSNPTRQAQALLRLGRLCTELGESDEARDVLQRALAIDESVGVFTADERSEISAMMQ